MTFGDLPGWDSWAGRYPLKGEPGITYEQHAHNATVTDCLFYRDESGELLGLFWHYNPGNLWERPGSCNLLVEPSHVRQGIGSALLREAWHRWPLTYDPQHWTIDGKAWLQGLIDRGKIDPDLTHSLDETFDWKPPPPGVGRDKT